jgi:hypothetical protein
VASCVSLFLSAKTATNENENVCLERERGQAKRNRFYVKGIFEQNTSSIFINLRKAATFKISTK